MKKILFVICCVLLFFNSNAQHYHIENFSVKDGLPQNSILSIYQDNRGYLWFGTFGGISKFDGVNFETFTALDGFNIRGVSSIIGDKFGNIWFGGTGGVCIYDGSTFVKLNLKTDNSTINVHQIIVDDNGSIWMATFTNGVFMYNGKTVTNYTTDDGLLSNWIDAICSDNNGGIWIGVGNKGISKFNHNSFENFTIDNGLIGNKIISLCMDRLDYLWILTTHGLCKFKGNSFEEKEFDTNILADLTPRVMSRLLAGKEGYIWILTEYGLIKYDDNGNNYTQINTIENSFRNVSNSSLYRDKNDNIWVGKFGVGVFKFIDERFTYFTQDDGLKPKLVYTISEDKEGNIWIGGMTGVSKIDKLGLTTMYKQKLVNNILVYAIIHDRNGILWMGGYDLKDGIGMGLLKNDGKSISRFTTKQGLINNYIKTILESSDGTLFIGTGEGISKFDGKVFENFNEINSRSNNTITSLYEDTNRIIWIGTEDGKVSRYDGQEFQDIDFFDSLGANSIRSITEDKFGNIWFATFQGIFIYDKNNKINNITKKEGLSSNIIYFLFSDEDTMWIGTSQGIDRLNVNKLEKSGDISIKHYMKESELVGLEGNTNATFKDSKGNIWFGMVEGVIKYNPSKDKPNTLEPFTHIKNIKMFYKNIDWSEYTDSITKWNHLPTNLELPFEDNHLTFEFIGINQKMPEEVKYQWRLEGFEEKWSPISKETKVTYSNLPPDKYTFMVKACNEDNLWNKKPTTFSFTITPPYWQTAWYYGLQILFFTAIIGFTLFLSRSGRYESILTIFIFITIFVIFDYIQNMCEPLYEEYVGSATLVKTILNLVLAAFLIPAQRFVRNNLRGKRR
ncbi:MAG: hypothetical protein JKY33_03275, partial [Bacteroidia bacterium]|nr:hypothetical protein [Bacteroidia bacterium]